MNNDASSFSGKFQNVKSNTQVSETDSLLKQSLNEKKQNALHDKERRVMEIRKRNQLYDMKMRLDGHGVMRKS